MTGSPPPVPFLGRCPVKGCRTTVRLLATQVLETVRSRYGSYEAYRPRFLVPGCGSAHGWVDVRPMSVSDLYRWDAVPCCVEHHRPVRLRQVEGVLREDVRCDARCTSAKGPRCECSCGGANHGGDF